MRKRLWIYLAFALVLGWNLYIRCFTVYFPQLRDRAAAIVKEQVTKSIAADVAKMFPQFNPLAKDKLLSSRVADYMAANKPAVDSQVDQLYKSFRSRFQDEKGQTYLMELDCWHWARYTQNVVEKGRPGDEVINGEQLDQLMLAPFGSYLHWDNFLFYFSAALYRVFNFFHKIDLFTFLFYLPLLFTTLLIASLFGFSSRLGGWLGGVIACLVVGMSPMFLGRSIAGWYDKDVLNLLFPVLIMWSYLRAHETADARGRALGIIFSSFWVGLFCFNWTFWWFIVAIVVLYELVALGLAEGEKIFRKQDASAAIRGHLISLGTFLLGTLFWVLVFSGVTPLADIYKQLRLALVLNQPLMASIWPNVYSTVGELRMLNIKESIDTVGGPIVFWPALVSVFGLCARAVVDKGWDKFKRSAALFLGVWFLSMAFASTRGIRFVVFTLPPLGISLGWGLREAHRFLSQRHVYVAHACVAAVAVAVTVAVVPSGYTAATRMYPLMDSTWHRVLTLVNEQTPKETILNSWWDFGDWFKVAAKRRVIFDGQSQDTPQAYWMAKALLGSDETKSMAILRMLNNGGNRAFETVDRHLNDPLRSVLLLESILGAPPEKARQVLLEYLPPQPAQEVMNYLYATPAKACFVVDPTLQYKMAAISFLGNWDFAKVYIAKNFNRMEKEKIISYLVKLGKDEQEMQRYYQEAFLIPRDKLNDWLSHPVSFYGTFSPGQEKDGVVYFSNGFSFDLKTQRARSNQGQVPRSVFLMQENNMVEVPQQDGNIGVSLLVGLSEDGKVYRCMLLDRDLGGSMFARLYYLRGKGLAHFLPYIDAEENNTFTRVFKIAW